MLITNFAIDDLKKLTTSHIKGAVVGRMAGELPPHRAIEPPLDNNPRTIFQQIVDLNPDIRESLKYFDVGGPHGFPTLNWVWPRKLYVCNAFIIKFRCSIGIVTVISSHPPHYGLFV